MTRLKKLGLLLGVATSVAVLGAAPALAASATVTATVNAGTLSLTTSAAPSVSVTLDGSDQTPTYTAALAANDDTGSGAGWNLTITSTQFTTGGGSPHTLATTASSLTGATSSCAGGSTCTNPTNSVIYPVAVPAGSTPPTAVKYFSAALNTGAGQFTNTP